MNINRKVGSPPFPHRGLSLRNIDALQAKDEERVIFFIDINALRAKRINIFLKQLPVKKKLE
jgi:hypothetical protein